MNKQRLPQAGRQIELLTREHSVEQIFGVHDAFYGIDTAPAYRKSRAAAFDDNSADILLTVRKVQPDNVDARRHYRADRPIRQPHHAVYHVAFGHFEYAGGGPLADESAYFLIGDRDLSRRRQSQDPQNSVAGETKQPDGRCAKAGQPCQWPRYDRRYPLGIGQRDALRYQLTEDQRQISDA